MKKQNLFSPIVAREKIAENFDRIRTWPGYYPARTIMEEIFSSFTENDGNFVEQFQTTGFDARIFELYLYSYFLYSGYQIDRIHNRPDFIVEKDGIKVAIEVTTVNQRMYSGCPSVNFDELDREQIRIFFEEELPIKFGSPIFSKLQKQYWKLDHCKGIPLVIAIEAFHDEEALSFSSNALFQLLFGLRQTSYLNSDGKLIIVDQAIKKHKNGAKEIPSGFFYQPLVENISAIVFTNSGTIAKFNRMGCQEGHYKGDIIFMRLGTCYDENPNASEPKKFKYCVNNYDHVETWGEGLSVFLNPNALIPLPKNWFVDAQISYIKDGQVISEVPEFFPYASKTLSILLHEKETKGIKCITKKEFEMRTAGVRAPYIPNTVERKWYATEDDKYIGTVFEDLEDNQFYCVIMKMHQERYQFDQIFDGFSSCYKASEYIKGKLKQTILAGGE